MTVFWQNALGMSVVIIALLACRPLFLRRVSARARYVAWLAVLVGLLIPFRVVPYAPLWTLSAPPIAAPEAARGNATTAPLALDDGAPRATVAPQPTANALSQAQPSGAGLSTPAPQPSHGNRPPALNAPAIPPLDVGKLLACLWALGALCALTAQCVRHARFFARVRRWRSPPTERERNALQEERARMGLTKTLPVYRCACATSPMVVGLFRPAMLMPELDLSEEELRLILRHELTHWARHDLWGKALMLSALVVHWFNPLVYVMARAMASDCEMSCDASVLANADLSERKRYGETILGVVRRQRRRHVALSTYFYEGKKDMKKRFVSMLDTSVRRKGGALIAAAIVMTLLSGSVVALSNPATPSDTGAGVVETPLRIDATPMPPATPNPTPLSNGTLIPDDWDAHRTPALFGVNSVEKNAGLWSPHYTPETTAYNRRLTRAETLRLYDLFYFYDHDGRRAETPAPVADAAYAGDAFALRAPVAEFAAQLPLDARDEVAWGAPALWADAQAAGLLPFLLFPDTEMSDTELLQLIEVVDAFDALVPYFDPWLQGDDQDNRPMTRAENLRLLEMVALCERDAGYRPTAALTNAPSDGLYIKGYNGGGETVYHYPEGRGMTDEELLQIAWELVQRRMRSASEAAYEAWMNAQGAQTAAQDATVGSAEEAVQMLRAIMGDVNVKLERAPSYDDTREAWNVTFVENVPVGAPYYTFAFTIDTRSGDLLAARVNYTGVVSVHSYLLGDMATGETLPNVATIAVAVDDPHWTEIAKAALARGRFYSGAEVIRLRGDDSMNGFCVKVDYADGRKAFLFLDPITDALMEYFPITDEELANWSDYVW